ELLTILSQGHSLTAESVAQTISMIREDEVRPSDVFTDVLLTARGRSLAPKTAGQKRYVDAIRRNVVTFAIGPAGTGKTYLEVAALAYMRGRTLNDSFIILDEAQNTTPEQMKMFLTRLGFGSKVVVNGDVTQIDLPTGQRSGLVIVEEILQGIEGLEFVQLGARDVVRHRIVQNIVEAYRVHGERAERQAAEADRGRPAG